MCIIRGLGFYKQRKREHLLFSNALLYSFFFLPLLMNFNLESFFLIGKTVIQNLDNTVQGKKKKQFPLNEIKQKQEE